MSETVSRWRVVASMLFWTGLGLIAASFIPSFQARVFGVILVALGNIIAGYLKRR